MKKIDKGDFGGVAHAKELHALGYIYTLTGHPRYPVYFKTREEAAEFEPLVPNSEVLMTKDYLSEVL